MILSTIRPDSVALVPPVAGDRFSRKISAGVLSGILALLLFSWLAFGAVDEWAIFILRSGAVLLFLVWAVGQVRQERLSIRTTILYVPAVCFFLLILVQGTTPLSAYRGDTIFEILNYAVYGVLAFLAIQVIDDSRRAEYFCLFLAGTGALIAVFALIQRFTSEGTVYWTVSVQQGAVIFGPYVNHNHYAGLMEMLTPFAVMISLSGRFNRSVRVLAGFFGALMGASIFLSGSRGGSIAFCVEIVCLSALYFSSSSTARSPYGILLLVIFGALLGLLADSYVVERMASLRDLSQPDVTGWRMKVSRDGLVMFRQRPLLGWGMGTFPTVYPQFCSFYSDMFVNEAHDDYVQLLAETGVIGCAIALWFLATVFRQGLQKIRSLPNSSAGRMLTIASITGVTGILVHSASDFNLHIPANAALFYMLCALTATPWKRTPRPSTP